MEVLRRHIQHIALDLDPWKLHFEEFQGTIVYKNAPVNEDENKQQNQKNNVCWLLKTFVFEHALVHTKSYKFIHNPEVELV